MGFLDNLKLCLHCCLFTCFEVDIEELNPRSNKNGITLYDYVDDEENHKRAYKLYEFDNSKSN
jgi:hypothetical protein